MSATHDLGACCCCGGRRRVRNIGMLQRRGSVPGTGWGCVVCGLPADGACYVACDQCVKIDAKPREVVRGYAASGEREPIESLSPEVFDHDMSLHEPGD
jgi:hypothetical protein